ncbi:hypothetical protein BLNAU_21239 [Blattamonas nauphoetae]|uniref:Uncharacterized protein n=1 Tax=Blattamonas nauphoetae TaxID=2049346 RepID=A0ABQ9WX08_9EUKA|nr:hypothetical protein BLNAU_21239 [Blattamonas nauphoetae]
MFFLFALLSASSFRSPNTAGEMPTKVELIDQNPTAKTAKIVLTYTGADAVASTAAVKLTFTEQPAATPPVTVEYDFTASATAFDATTKKYTQSITDLDTKLKIGKSYKLTEYSYGGSAVSGTPPTDTIVVQKALTVTLTATSKTKYTLKCELAANVTVATTLTVKFTAGEKVNSVSVEFAANTKAKEVELDVVTTAADGKFLAGTEYTISCDGYVPSQTTFTPADNSKLTGESSLAKEGEKEDGAKDKVTVTLLNALLPVESGLPENYTQKLTLKDTAPTSANGEHKLDKSDAFKWTHAAGSVAVEYLFKDCPIKKDSTVTATLVISPDLTFTDQTITYAAGAKSVASVQLGDVS